MKRLLMSVGFLAVLAYAASFGCSKPQGPCSQDYNCEDGQYCVRGACTNERPEIPKAEPAPKEVAQDTKKTPEPTKDAGHPTEKIVDNGPVKCTSSDDCKDPAKPNCFKKTGVCLKGYIEFNFNGGHFVINPSEPTKSCSSTSQCKSWQVCSQKRCLYGSGRSNNASGKLGEDGVSLTDISYAYVGKIEDGSTVLRTVVVTDYSDKLSKILEFDIPVSMVKVGTISLDGVKVTARFIHRLSEFTPPKNELIGTAIGGSITFTQAGTQEGAKLTGTAEFHF